MNKTKRGLQLGAAITSIVFASILAVGTIYLIIVAMGINGDLPDDMAYESAQMSIIIATYVLILLGCIANLIVSSLICRKPQENMHKGLCIASLVMNAVIALFELINLSVWCLLPLAVVGLFIASLCVKNNVAEENTTVNQPVEEKQDD